VLESAQISAPYSEERRRKGMEDEGRSEVRKKI
jgi:hypothetical protein